MMNALTFIKQYVGRNAFYRLAPENTEHSGKISEQKTTQKNEYLNCHLGMLKNYITCLDFIALHNISSKMQPYPKNSKILLCMHMHMRADL